MQKPGAMPALDTWQVLEGRRFLSPRRATCPLLLLLFSFLHVQRGSRCWESRGCLNPLGWRQGAPQPLPQARSVPGSDGPAERGRCGGRDVDLCVAGPAGWPGVPAPGQGGKAWLDGRPLLPPEVRACVPPPSLTGRQSALVSLVP